MAVPIHRLDPQTPHLNRRHEVIPLWCIAVLIPVEHAPIFHRKPVQSITGVHDHELRLTFNIYCRSCHGTKMNKYSGQRYSQPYSHRDTRKQHVALYEKMQQGPAVHMLGCYNLKTIYDITNI